MEIFYTIPIDGNTLAFVYRLLFKLNSEIDKEMTLVILSGIINEIIILECPALTDRDREIVVNMLQSEFSSITEAEEF